MNELMEAYSDAYALVRAAINGDHTMAAEMINALDNDELRQTLQAATALAAVLAKETSRRCSIPFADLMHELKHPRTDTP